MTELKGNKKLPLPMTEHLTDAMIEAALEDLRGRSLLKYLFDAEPENVCGAYGTVERPFDLETQREIVSTLYAKMEAAKPSTPSSGCVWLDLERPCQTEGCTICRPSTPIDDEGLLKQPTKNAPSGCHCRTFCAAPIVMGQQQPCRRNPPLKPGQSINVS